MEEEAIRILREHLRCIERHTVGWSRSDCQCCGLTLAQCHVLLEVGKSGTVSLGDLAARLGLDPSTLSRTVQSMVRAGLLRRTTNRADRRCVSISLTPRGRALLEQVDSGRNAYYTRVFGFIPREKHSQVMEAVVLLSEAMKRFGKNSEEVGDGC
ncbi:MAG: MarR family transcriptional regulator [Bacillota bacterium]|jgi:DNA-binding MarR family transcriptional regulator